MWSSRHSCAIPWRAGIFARERPPPFPLTFLSAEVETRDFGGRFDIDAIGRVAASNFLRPVSCPGEVNDGHWEPYLRNILIGLAESAPKTAFPKE